MERFARTAAAVAERSGKLEKVAILAEYFRSLDDADLTAAARFFTGNPLAARDQRTLSVGYRAILAAARRLWGFDDEALRGGYREHGDLGSALATVARPPADAMLFRETLSPATLSERFEEIAGASGKNSGKRRDAALERILRACEDPLVVSYVVKILTGDLRIGLREGLVLDAIASAFGSEPGAIRRAAMASGDVGEVAVAAKRGTLAEIRIAYGVPIGFMLASPIPFGDDYAELRGALWHAQDKYDGIRAQAHVRDGRAVLFSRTLNDVSASYPEIVADLERIPGAAILDGEILAVRDGRALPFRELQARLQRKTVDEELQREVPLAYVAFDLIASGEELLLDEPLAVRREQLEALVSTSPHVLAAPVTPLDDPGAETVNELFDAARARGNEGLMLKRADSPYAPGRRGKWWLKLKRELATLDVVVNAVEWGHGKRAKVLSDYTFAVRGADGGLLTIGKAFSGLTDAEIAELTPWFLEHRLPASARRAKGRRGEIPVEPKVVLEVAFDIIQESELHESGFSLRFPRIVRVRDDKPAQEIDTIERVREIYAQMLEREGP